MCGFSCFFCWNIVVLVCCLSVFFSVCLLFFFLVGWTVEDWNRGSQKKGEFLKAVLFLLFFSHCGAFSVVIFFFVWPLLPISILWFLLFLFCLCMTFFFSLQAFSKR